MPRPARPAPSDTRRRKMGRGREALGPHDVAATVYHHLGIDARSVTFRDRLDRPMFLLDEGEPIRELIG